MQSFLPNEHEPEKCLRGRLASFCETKYLDPTSHGLSLKNKKKLRSSGGRAGRGGGGNGNPVLETNRDTHDHRRRLICYSFDGSLFGYEFGTAGKQKYKCSQMHK